MAYREWKKLATSESRKSKTNEYACHLQQKLLHPENFDDRLLALQCGEEQALLDHRGLNVDVEDRKVRIGVVKPLSSSRGRSEYAASDRLPSKQPSAPTADMYSVPQPALICTTASEEPHGSSELTESGAEQSAPKIPTMQPRRRTRIVSEDVWKRSSFSS